MKGVTQPAGPPRLFVMCGRYAVLGGVRERSQAAAAGAALATPYGISESRIARTDARTSTPGSLRPKDAVSDEDTSPMAAQLGIKGAPPQSGDLVLGRGPDKMSFERVTAGTGLGAGPAPAPRLGEATPTDAASPEMRLQILSTEHWSLLASRSLAWNESFSRAGMFLTTLSGAVVALGLVGGASGFGEAFTLFALVILPVVLFIGVATWIRLGSSNYHEAMCVIRMNSIRAAYLELAPDLERYFVMSAHDDRPGMGITMGVPPGGGVMWIAHLLAGTPTVVIV